MKKKKEKERISTVHDKTGQLYRVKICGDIVVDVKKFEGQRLLYIAARRPLNFGIKAFKRTGASKKEVREYKQRIHKEASKVHKQYIEKTATFEKLHFAEGL